MNLVQEPREFGLLVRGRQVPASTGAMIDVRSPATGEVVARVPRAAAADVEAAVAAAREGFAAWSALTAYDRERIIRRATAHVRTKAAEIGRLMALEQGKPLAQSVGEIGGSCDTLDYFAAEGVRVEGYTNPTERADYRSTVIHQPVGVCALITPWNYPVSLLSWKLGPALAAGCAAIVKPTSTTPTSPLAFCAALVEGGIPAEVLGVLTGPGAALGELLVRHPGVAKVAMTGSTATGKRLMEIFGPRLGKISLELGGNCPAVVCADADPGLAAEVIAYKAFRNLGQSCSSIQRVYAHRSIHDEVVARLAAIAGAMTIGDGITDPKVDLGPMVSAGGRALVEEHVADAVAHGATVVAGGRRPAGEAYAAGHYYLPTILTGITPAMRFHREENFGPVAGFAAFDDLAEAVAAANDTDYGLVAYLFTRDHGTTVRVSEALEAGTVCVNHGAVNTNYGPYAGWKESGYGLELSRRAIFEYLKTKHVKVRVL